MLLAFLGLSAVVICTPGPARPTIRSALLGGRAGHVAALGTFLGLGLAFCLMRFGWLVAYGVLVASGRRLLDRPRVSRALDAVAGVALIGFGVRLATSPDGEEATRNPQRVRPGVTVSTVDIDGLSVLAWPTRNPCVTRPVRR